MSQNKNILKSWNVNFKTFLVFGFLLITGLIVAQNKNESTYSAAGIKEVVVNGDQIFNISVVTKATKTIELKSVSDGEYGNDYQVISEVKGNQLFVRLQRVAMAETPDDKRNAHKVVAAELEISMPENLNLSIKSDIGSVKANGKFNKLNFNLVQGGCTVNATVKIGTIRTIDGNINLVTKEALIETDSNSGTVDFPSDMFGFNLWRLSTNAGNITVKKQE